MRAHENRFNDAIDGDLLVIAKLLARLVEAWRKKLFSGLFVRQLSPLPQPCPKFSRGWEGVDLPFDAGEEIKLDDLLAVGGVGEFQVEDFGVFLGLLEPVARRLVAGLGLDHGDGEIAGVAEPVIGPFLFQPPNLLRGGHDPPIREGMLLLDLVVGPAGPVEFRQDVDATSIGFSFGHGIIVPYSVRIGPGDLGTSLGRQNQNPRFHPRQQTVAD